VVRFAPDGRLDRTIPVPAKMVTSLVFGGAHLDELYVVSADNTDDASRLGTVFRLSSDMVGAVGMPAPLVRI